MSLSTRGFSAPKKPGVHYISAFFDPVAHEAAQQAQRPRSPVPESAADRARDSRKKPGAENKPHGKSALSHLPDEARMLCLAFGLRAGCGRMLYRLWKARGQIVSYGDLASGSNTSRVVSEIRQSNPALIILPAPAIGYSLDAAAVRHLDAVIARGMPT